MNSLGKSHAVWLRMLLFLGLSAVCGTIAANIFSLRHARVAKPFPLAADSADLDVGTVWEQSAYRHRITITNQSSQTITVQRFDVSCSCTSVAPSSLHLAPGASGEIELLLDLTPRAPHGAIPEGDWQFGVEVRPQVVGWPLDAASWQLTAAVRKALTFTPSVLHFEDSLIRGTPFAPRSVRVHPNIPIEALSARVNPLFGHVAVGERSEDGSYEVIVTPYDGLGIGPFNFAVELEAITANEILPPALLHCSGVVVTDLFATPSTAFLEGDPHNGVQFLEIVLQSRSGQEFSVEQVFAEGVVATAEPAATPKSREHCFRIHLSAGGKRTNATANPRVVFLTVNSEGRRVPVDVAIGNRVNHVR